MKFGAPSAMDFDPQLRHSQGVDHEEQPSQGSPSNTRNIGALRIAVSNYFRTRVSNQGEVDDLVQEVFTRLAARREGEPIEHLDRYLFQTAASVLADRSRRQKARRAELHVEFDPEHHSESDFDPHRTLSGREDLRAARVALLALPERTRMVFILHRLEGEKYRDIAAQLGISVSAVEKHMARAAFHMLANLGDGN